MDSSGMLQPFSMPLMTPELGPQRRRKGLFVDYGDGLDRPHVYFTFDGKPMVAVILTRERVGRATKEQGSVREYVEKSLKPASTMAAAKAVAELLVKDEPFR